MRWLFLGVMAALPLQWFVVAHSPLGVGRLHELVALMFAAVVCFRYRSRAWTPVVAAMLPFVVAMVAMLVLWTGASLLNGLGPASPLQEMLLLITSGAVAVTVFRAASGSDHRVVDAMRWTAVVSITALILGLVLSMLRNGVNPASTFALTLSSGDPEVLQKELFKASFSGFGFDTETVRGNIRHEVFGAILLAMLVSSWAILLRPFRSARDRQILRAFFVLGTILLLTSLSRSTMIAASMWLVLLAVRTLVTMRVSRRAVVTAFAATGVVVAGLVTGFVLVLYNRFIQDTSSYESRGRLYASAITSIREHPFMGGVSTAGASSHNFVVDAWLRGGFFTMLLALAVIGSLLLLSVRLVRHLHRLPMWMVPVTAALALPIVRMLTSGGGLIPPVSWIALGFITGALAYLRSPKKRPGEVRAAADPVEGRKGIPVLEPTS